MYIVYAMSQNMALNCLYFPPGHWQWKNFANQSDLWPWQTVCIDISILPKVTIRYLA